MRDIVWTAVLWSANRHVIRKQKVQGLFYFHFFLFYLIFIVYFILFFLEREKAWACFGGWQRERATLKETPCPAGSLMLGSVPWPKITTWAKIKSWTPNRLSHPGAPLRLFYSKGGDHIDLHQWRCMKLDWGNPCVTMFFFPGALGWLHPLRVCFWLRFWPQGPGVKLSMGVPAQREAPFAASSCPSPTAPALALSQISKIKKKKTPKFFQNKIIKGPLGTITETWDSR